MKTAQQREEDFRRDLQALLEKHSADLEVTDDRKPWGMHSGIAVVTMMAERDADGNETAAYTEFRI